MSYTKFKCVDNTFTIEKEVGAEKEIYKHNSVTLGEDGEGISKQQFKDLIQQEVRNFTNQSFDNIVLLAGAGASVVVNADKRINKDYGKTMNDLLNVITSELNKDSQYFNLEDLAKFCCYPFSEKDEKLDLANFNLEDFLSNLITFEKFMEENDEKEKYTKSKNFILQLIVENTSYDYSADVFKHGKVINHLNNKLKSNNKLAIVTTNYDTLLEDAADSLNYTVNDGFTFSYEPKFDSDMFDWDLVKPISGVHTKELEYKKNLIILLKIHGSLTWEEFQGEIYRKGKAQVETPVMVFPSSDKYAQSYGEPYFELFSKFQELLKKPNTLLISTGFSFADNHISKMVTQAIKNNAGLSLLVTDYNIDQNTQNWKELEELMMSGYRIAFLSATMNSDLSYYLGDDV